MKKLIGAMALAGLVVGCAHSPEEPRAERLPEDRDVIAEPTQEEMDRTAQRTEEEAEEAWGQTREEAREAGEEVAETFGLATERQGTFREEDAFEMEGQLRSPGFGAITIVREGLPPAVLDVRDQTRVMLDGREVRAEELQEGLEVRARFQVEGHETVAVSIEATSTGEPRLMEEPQPEPDLWDEDTGDLQQ